MTSSTSRTAGLAIVTALAVLLGSCGGSDTSAGGASSTLPTTSSDATTSSSGSSSSSSTDSAAASTTIQTTSTSESSTTTWDGEAVSLFAKLGDRLGVVGVEHDDELNIRSGPGVDFEIVASVGPTGSVVATGSAWQIPGAFWYEVESSGTTGWANIRFLAYIGATDDATSEIVAELGEIPEAPTMLELGLVSAQPLLSDEPPTRVTLTAPPTVGDLGEVVYDLIGLGDDSLLGYRLHVFGQPSEDGDGFSLKSVERTLLCGRGLAGEICV